MTIETPNHPRRQRADGARSRQAILLTAARLASRRGIDRLSIADLADEAGMSKSGLYAHFGSKEELQLATIATAAEIFNREVVEPAGRAAPGLDRLHALCERYIDHLEGRVFPGGCFFASAGAELQGRTGPVHDRVGEFNHGWLAQLTEQATLARDAGDLAQDEEVDQLAFDLDAFLVYAHFAFSFSADNRVLAKARRAVRLRLGLA